MRKIVKKAVLGFLKYSKVYHILKPYFRGNGMILMFHRVLPDLNSHNRILNNLALEVSAEFLESIIVELKKDYEIISLDSLYEKLMHNSNGKPFVCFTFDDGYVDNYEVSYPILKKHNVPFTIYVTSSFPEKKAILWWHMLESLLLNSNVITFKYSDSKYYFNTGNLKQKNNTFRQLSHLILNSPQHQIKNFIDALFHDSDCSVSAATYNSLAMTWDQIIELSNDPLVTIGAHTENHYNLKQLTAEEVKWEIISS